MSNAPSLIIGIDPGFSGAVAALEIRTGKLLSVVDLPLTENRKKKRIDSKLLEEVLDSMTAGQMIQTLFAIEKVHSMPSQSSVATYTFGYNTGIIQGVMGVRANCSVIEIDPAVWKSAFGLSRNKEESLALARRYFPYLEGAFLKRKHDGRAEAALICQYVFKRLKGF